MNPNLYIYRTGASHCMRWFNIGWKEVPKKKQTIPWRYIVGLGVGSFCGICSWGNPKCKTQFFGKTWKQIGGQNHRLSTHLVSYFFGEANPMFFPCFPIIYVLFPWFPMGANIKLAAKKLLELEFDQQRWCDKKNDQENGIRLGKSIGEC